ncbi:MAG: purine-nucleoside phosphorylase [Nitrososphaerota archaeon]
MPAHIKANRGEIAERVIIAGDPARVEQLSRLMECSRLVNANRGFITFTGKYKSFDISVACHGIGGPSAAIVFEELVSLGAKLIVRLGTTGGLRREIKRGEFIIPTFAGHVSGPLAHYCRDFPPCTAPDLDLTLAIIGAVKKRNIQPYIGPVFSNDAFYAESESLAERLSVLGYIGIEMECATIFGLGMLRNVKTASLLVVSNNLIEKSELADARELQQFIEIAGLSVMDALTSINVK